MKEVTLTKCQHDMNKPNCTIGSHNSTCPYCGVIFCVWSADNDPTNWDIRPGEVKYVANEN